MTVDRSGYGGRAHPALLFVDWPETDRAAWDYAVRPPDFLDSGGAAVGWRPASRRSAQGAYGRWLYWLQVHERAALTERPANRFTPPRVRAYVQTMRQKCAPVTVSSYLGVLCMVVIAVFPDEDWDWLRRIQAQHCRRARPTRDKHRRLVPSEDLLKLGLHLLGDAGLRLDTLSEADRRSRTRAARDYRNGLLIAILATRPLRVKNLLEIEIGRELQQDGDHTTVAFGGSAMKNHRPLVVSWPDMLVPALTRYLDEVRPILLTSEPTGGNRKPAKSPGARLWIGQGGTCLSPCGLNKALARHTKRQFGHVVNAHLFRDCVATTIANDNPNNLRFAARLLGHTAARTTERNYVLSDCEGALAAYHRTLQELSPRTRLHQRAPGPAQRSPRR